VKPITAKRDFDHSIENPTQIGSICGGPTDGWVYSLGGGNENRSDIGNRAGITGTVADELRPIEAAKHVARAKHALTCLRQKVGAGRIFPELEESITDLEIALNILADTTGGML
jgi:hypothetical protein